MCFQVEILLLLTADISIRSRSRRSHWEQISIEDMLELTFGLFGFMNRWSRVDSYVDALDEAQYKVEFVDRLHDSVFLEHARPRIDFAHMPERAYPVPVLVDNV